MSNKVYIVGAKRSPNGSFLGAFKDVHPAELGAQVLKKLLAESRVPVAKIDEVIVGQVLSAGVGQGFARQVSLKAGVPIEVPAYSLNMVCGSGMKSIMNAYASIKAKMANLIVADGVESMSQAPYLVPAKARDGVRMGDLNLADHLLKDALVDVFNNYHMGVTAENIVKKYGISREEQDAFALKSQEKAIKAVDSGAFDPEIVPIEVKTRKETLLISRDEYPNRTTNAEKMAKLRPAFLPDGTVTAGSSSGINDGASFVIVASEEAVKQYQLPVLAEIISVGQGGVDPSVMGLGPVPAIREALNNAKMTLKQMELVELNEAFAAQSLGVVKELVEEHQIDRDELLNKTNINGGAIALGHPLGNSGNRITVTLLYGLMATKRTYGLASLCIGGGMGTAIVIKRV